MWLIMRGWGGRVVKVCFVPFASVSSFEMILLGEEEGTGKGRG
jgi:hypothetical protein